MKHEATDYHCDKFSYEYRLNKHLNGHINVTNPGIIFSVIIARAFFGGRVL